MAVSVRRLAMVPIGLGVLLAYVASGTIAFYGLLALWSARPSLSMTMLGAGLFSLVFGVASYYFGTAQVLASLRAVDLPPQRAPRTHSIVDRIAAEMDVARPRLLIADLQAPNAFAIGGARNGAIVLDTSLFSLLTLRELRALLAHELAHLESYDSFVQTLAVATLRTLVSVLLVVLLPVTLVTTGLARGVALLRGRPAEWSTTTGGRFRRRLNVAVSALLFVFTLLVRAHSRRREIAADDRAVDVTGDPLALASALRKLDHAANPRWGLFSTLYVTHETDTARLLSTHPPLEDRIQRLLDRVEPPATTRWRRIEIE